MKGENEIDQEKGFHDREVYFIFQTHITCLPIIMCSTSINQVCLWNVLLYARYLHYTCNFCTYENTKSAIQNVMGNPYPRHAMGITWLRPFVLSSALLGNKLAYSLLGEASMQHVFFGLDFLCQLFLFYSHPLVQE